MNAQLQNIIKADLYRYGFNFEKEIPFITKKKCMATVLPKRFENVSTIETGIKLNIFITDLNFLNFR